jgi:hypothetical protein
VLHLARTASGNLLAMAKKSGGDDARDPRTYPGTRAELAQLRKIEDGIEKDLREEAKRAFALGERVIAIVEKGLHHSKGYPTLEAYLDARFPRAARTLMRYRRVAGKFEEATVVKHGATKLGLAPSWTVRLGEDGEEIYAARNIRRSDMPRVAREMIDFAGPTASAGSRKQPARRSRAAR